MSVRPLHLRRAGRQAGFTLLELLVTITVLGILVAFAVPSFSYLAANTKMKTATTTLHLSLLKARSEAVKRSGAVTLTPNNSGDWAAGWTMTAGAANTVVLVQDAIAGVTMTPTPNPLTSLVFLSTGRIAGTAPSFSVAPLAKNRTQKTSVKMDRCVSVAANGSPYIKEAACS